MTTLTLPYLKFLYFLLGSFVGREKKRTLRMIVLYILKVVRMNQISSEGGGVHQLFIIIVVVVVVINLLLLLLFISNMIPCLGLHVCGPAQ